MAKTESAYWKNYFSTEEKKAVQKNAQKYILSEIKKKRNDWKNIFTSFNIKNGSISSEDVKSIDMGKIKNLSKSLSEKVYGNLHSIGISKRHNFFWIKKLKVLLSTAFAVLLFPNLDK